MQGRLRSPTACPAVVFSTAGGEFSCNPPVFFPNQVFQKVNIQESQVDAVPPVNASLSAQTIMKIVIFILTIIVSLTETSVQADFIIDNYQTRLPTLAGTANRTTLNIQPSGSIDRILAVGNRVNSNTAANTISLTAQNGAQQFSLTYDLTAPVDFSGYEGFRFSPGSLSPDPSAHAWVVTWDVLNAFSLTAGVLSSASVSISAGQAFGSPMAAMGSFSNPGSLSSVQFLRVTVARSNLAGGNQLTVFDFDGGQMLAVQKSPEPVSLLLISGTAISAWLRRRWRQHVSPA